MVKSSHGYFMDTTRDSSYSSDYLLRTQSVIR